MVCNVISCIAAIFAVHLCVFLGLVAENKR